MSIWTHAAGVIRLDFINPEEYGLAGEKYAIEKLLGKEFSYGNMDRALLKDLEAHPEDYLPFGSEGSLRHTIFKNPNRSGNVTSLPMWTIVIGGDLRDYDTPEKIVEWFKKACKKLKYVRDATVVAREDLNNKVVSWCAQDTWAADNDLS